MSKSDKKRFAALAFSAGSSFFGTVFGGYLLGSLLDQAFAAGIVFTVIGTILGFIAANVIVFKIILVIDKKIG